MKKWLLLLTLLFGIVPLFGQTIPASANLTAQDSGACTTANACLTVNLNQTSASSVIQLTGTWSGTNQFEGTTSTGGTFVSVLGTVVGGTSTATSATGNGAWRFTTSGLAQIRVRVSTYTSGTIAVTITSSTGSSGSAGGGGGASGCVPSGSTGQILEDNGSGGCGDSLATDNGSSLSYSGTGGINATGGPVKAGGSAGAAGAFICPQGTANGHPMANTVTVECPGIATAYELKLPGASASGIVRRDNSAAVDTESISELSGDATTSGSNAVTVGKINGTAVLGIRGTASTGTPTISSNNCAPPVTVAVTGMVTTSVINASFSANPTGVVGFQPGAMLTIISVPTSGNANFYICNNTGSSLTIGSAQTINFIAW